MNIKKNSSDFAKGLFIFITLLSSGCVTDFPVNNTVSFSPDPKLGYLPQPLAGQGRLIRSRPAEEVATINMRSETVIGLIKSSDGTIFYEAYGIDSFYENLAGKIFTGIPSGVTVQLPPGSYTLGARLRLRGNVVLGINYSRSDRYVVKVLQKGRHYLLEALLTTNESGDRIYSGLKLEEVIPEQLAPE